LHAVVERALDPAALAIELCEGREASIPSIRL